MLGVGSQILRSQGVIEMTKHNTIQFFFFKKEKRKKEHLLWECYCHRHAFLLYVIITVRKRVDNGGLESYTS